MPENAPPADPQPPPAPPAVRVGEDLSPHDAVIARWTRIQGVTVLLATVLAGFALKASLDQARAGLAQARDNAKQVEQNNILLKAQIYNEATAYCTEIDKLFLQNKHLRKYYYKGVDIKESDPDYDDFASMADTVIDTFDMATITMSIKDVDGNSVWPEPIGWRKWMVDTFSTSPGLCRYFNTYSGWYDENKLLKEIAQEGKALGEKRRAAGK